jgi:hypothetical protein
VGNWKPSTCGPARTTIRKYMPVGSSSNANVGSISSHISLLLDSVDRTIEEAYVDAFVSIGMDC